MRFVGFFLALPLDGGILALLKLFPRALILALTNEFDFFHISFN